MAGSNRRALRTLWSPFNANAAVVVVFVCSTLAVFFPLVGLGFGLWNGYIFPVPPGQPLFDYLDTLGLASVFGLATAVWYGRWKASKIREVAEQADGGDHTGAARRLSEVTGGDLGWAMEAVRAYLRERQGVPPEGELPEDVRQLADAGDPLRAAMRLGELTGLEPDEALARIEAYLVGRAQTAEPERRASG
jgi:hypothetical protein